jgi:hypothetical protein
MAIGCRGWTASLDGQAIRPKTTSPLPRAEFGQCTVTLVPFFTEAALLAFFATNAERWTAGVRRSSQGREALHRGRMATMDAPVIL